MLVVLEDPFFPVLRVYDPAHKGGISGYVEDLGLRSKPFFEHSRARGCQGTVNFRRRIVQVPEYERAGDASFDAGRLQALIYT